MVRKIAEPARVPAPGGKLIDEYIGRVNTRTHSVSIARITAPPGWSGPHQTPDFDEVIIPIRGTMRIEHDGGATDAAAGDVVHCNPMERVRMTNPFAEEAEFWAICVPAFKDAMAHREDDEGG